MHNKIKEIFKTAKNNKASILFITVFVVTLAILYTSVLPSRINIDQYRVKLFKEHKDIIKGRLDVGKLQLELPLTGGIVIKTDYVNLYRKNGKPAILAKKVKVKIAIIPILFNDIVIKGIDINNLDARLIRKGAIKTDIEDLIPEKFPVSNFNIKLINTKGTVENYKVQFTDKYLIPNKEFVFSGGDINLYKLTLNKKVKAKLTGIINNKTNFDVYFNLKLPLKKKLVLNDIDFSGNFKNLDLKDIDQYIKINGITGKINTETKLTLKDKQLNIDSKNFVYKPVNIPDYLFKIKKGFINLNSIVSKNNLTIQDLTIKSEDIDSSLSGNILQWRSKHPIFNLGLKTNEFNIKSLTDILPHIDSTKELFYKIDKYKIDGLTKLNLQISGVQSKPDFSGTITLKNYGFKLDNNLFISGIKGTFNFNKNIIQVNDLLIPLSSTDKIVLNGDIDFANKTFNKFRVESNNIKLKNINNILIWASKSFTNLNLLSKGDSLNGILNIDLLLNGLVSKPSMEGYLSLEAKTNKIKYIENSFSNIRSTIKFNKTTISSKDSLIAITPNNKIKITGEYDFYNKLVNNLTIKSNKLNLRELQKSILSINSKLHLPNNGLDKIKITGTTDFNITLKGTINNLKPHGTAKLNNVGILSNQSKQIVNNINGLISFSKNIKLENITALIRNNRVIITGQSDLKGNSKLLARIPDLKLADLKDLILQLNLGNKSDRDILNKTHINGSISGDITINTNNKKITPEANIKINKTKFSYPSVITDLTILKGTLKLNNNNFTIYDVVANAGKSNINITGNISNLNKNSPDFNIEARTNNVDMDIIKKLCSHNKSFSGISHNLSQVDELKGNIKLNIHSNNKGNGINVNLDSVRLLTKSLKNPIRIKSGEIKLNNKMFLIKDLKVGYGETKVKLTGNISNLTSPLPLINIGIKGKISPIDFNELYFKEINESLVFSKPAYFEGHIKGNLNDWQLSFNSNIPEDAQLAIKGLLQKPYNMPIKMELSGNGSTKGVNINNILFQIGESIFNADGKLSYSSEDIVLLDEFNIKIPTISLDQLNNFIAEGLLTEKMTGKVKADLKISGKLLDPELLGYLDFSNISLPILKIKDTSLNLQFNGKSLSIDGSNINVNNTIFKISAQINNLKKIPIEINNLKLYSPSIRLSDLLDSASQKSKNIPLIPIEIKNGSIKIDDAIIDKLITSNLTGNITLCPTGLLQFYNITLKTAGGTARGNFYVDLIKENLGAQLQIFNIKANAASTVLLDLPNEIFGDLNATIVFDSNGNDYDQIISNAKAKASLSITNGRFTRLGSLEHLLTASNIINGGIVGLNLNNILGSIIPMQTGRFDLLTGDFQVDKGTLYTNNLITRGRNLSLEVTGKYNIASEDADLKFKGKLSQNVSGLLGALGKLNIGTITDFIPGLGFIPGVKKSRGLLDFIPGLGFIPGFGQNRKQNNVKNFAVELQGKLYDMSSVKNFRWVKR